MNWTSEKPTKEGWYWTRKSPDGARREMSVYGGRVTMSYPVWVRGDEEPELAYVWDDNEWLGPITPEQYIEWGKPR